MQPGAAPPPPPLRPAPLQPQLAQAIQQSGGQAVVDEVEELARILTDTRTRIRDLRTTYQTAVLNGQATFSFPDHGTGVPDGGQQYQLDQQGGIHVAEFSRGHDLLREIQQARALEAVQWAAYNQSINTGVGRHPRVG